MEGSTKKTLQSLVDSIDGLEQVFIADREGVPMATAATSLGANAETLLRPQLLTSYQTVLERTDKLGLGTQTQLLCSYGQLQLILFNIPPLTVTLIAASRANTGLLLALRPRFELIVDQLHQIIYAVLPKID